jgi:thiamine pyrophosphokinase
MGTAQISVVHDRRQLSGSVGELVSLLPVHGDARGVTTTGLAYPLAGETLRAGTSRGVSNVLVETSASVSVADGSLLAIQPDALRTPDPPAAPGSDPEPTSGPDAAGRTR